MRARICCLVVLLIWGLAVAPAAGAQERQGEVRVVVHDQTGAVLPFARMVLVNGAGETRESGPDALGVAVIAGVPFGRWRLTVSADGFQPFERAVTVNRATTILTAQLRVALREEIVVNDRSISSRSGNAFSFILTPDEIAALPDDPDEMAEALQQMAGPGARIFVDGFGGGRLPPKNQIQQIRFRTNPFSAENHDAGMVRVDVITRPGMNRWGGMANAGFRDDVLNARHAFAPDKGAEAQKRFTASAGGPLVEGRTSFSVSADGERSYDSQTILAAVPGETLNSQVRRPVEAAGVRLRVDHALGQHNQLMAQYERRTRTRSNLGVGDFDLPDRAFISATTLDQIRAVNNRVIGTSAFNELRVSYTAQSSEDRPFSDAPTVRVLDAFTAGGASRSGMRAAREIEIANNVDFAIGGHTLRAGVLFEGGRWNSTSAFNTNGTFTFATLEDYVRGRPSLYTRRVGESAVSYTHVQAGWYLQDDFRLGRDVSLGLGVRQEIQTHLPDGRNIAPRAAFSWNPRGSQTTIRGGWGIFHEWYDTNLLEQTLRLDGTRQEEIVVINPGYPDAGAGAGTSLPPSVIRAADDLVMPTIRQASIGVERQVVPWLTLRADFTRLRGSNTLRSVNVNTPIDGVRPDPAFGNITEIVSTGKSETDRLTIGARAMMPGRRTSIGATYQLGRSSNFADSPLSLPSNSADPDADWGPSAQDVRHRVSLMGSVPLVFGVRVGFQAQGTSAVPFTITTGTDENGDTVFNDRPEGVGRNSARGAGTWNANLRVSRSFGFGGPGSGPAGPGGGGGPMTMGGGTGAGAGGGVPVIIEGGASRYRIDFFVQAFNVFNHTNFNQFVGNLRSPFFGRATSAGPSRRLEIGATFVF